MYCSKCGAILPDGETNCPNCKDLSNTAKNNEISEIPFHGMKWFKFNIYFSLFFVGILTIISGAFGLLELRFVMALLWIFHGIFAIITRFALASYKKIAPKMIVSLNIIYVCVITYDSIFVSGQINSGVVIGILLAILNYVYFKKRSDLFTN